jgi:long-chain acyl-CoA synthetase
MSVGKEQLTLKMEEIKRDIMQYVNSKVNRFSKISKVVDNEEEFEKTPTKKIRRFLYSGKGKKEDTQNK